jgi:Uma2 family endonuclease
MSRVTLPTTRFTFAEFMRMVDADVFGTTRVELINGRIYRMAPQRDPHMVAISKTADAIQRVKLPTDWLIIQGTLRLDAFSAPDPDFQWCDVPVGTPEHRRRLPILLIEISDTTYKRDSGVKLRKYAEHGIRDYWIVNLPADRVEVYRDPENPTGDPTACRYASCQLFARSESVPLLVRPNLSLAVNDLLP